MSALKRTLALGVCMAAVVSIASVAPARDSELAEARQATAKFHKLAHAEDAGYGLFTDAAGIACIDQPGQGTMGIHYVKGALVGDGAVDERTPEALVYEPRPNGRLKLVALEYVVFQEDWDELHPNHRPSLFGKTFALVDAGNRYGLPPFYALHVWLWKDNPSGLFADWNPAVSC